MAISGDRAVLVKLLVTEKIGAGLVSSVIA
jgi:hypothetical protein